MQFEQLKTPKGQTMEGPLLIMPKAFGDERGWFYESWNQRKFDDAAGEAVVFSQDNHSRSVQGVLRGLHYQLAPEPQAKLVRASLGSIFDLAVDIRQSSPTFGQWWEPNSRPRTKASCGFPRVSPTAFSPSAPLRRYSTKRGDSGTKPARGSLSGTTLIWPLPGRLSGWRAQR